MNEDYRQRLAADRATIDEQMQRIIDRHTSPDRWYNQPIPSRFHRCRVAEGARIKGTLYERCACGGVRLYGSGPWIERNSRRQEP